MEDYGLYLIDNGYILCIFIKANVPSELIQSLFGVPELHQITGPVTEDTVFENSNPLSTRILNIVDSIRGSKTLFQNLIFVFEGTEAERL